MKLSPAYHPLLVTLHWALAVLIVAELIVGVLSVQSESDPHKIVLLRWHMAGGVTIVALMLVRLFVRLRTSGPPRANRIAPIIHYGFYLLVLLLAITGFTTAILVDLGEIVFGPPGGAVPPILTSPPSFVVHASLAVLLAGLVVLHVGVALYRQCVRHDGVLRRMSWRLAR